MPLTQLVNKKQSISQLALTKKGPAFYVPRLMALFGEMGVPN
jgi:hypothetical protein